VRDDRHIHLFWLALAHSFGGGLQSESSLSPRCENFHTAAGFVEGHVKRRWVNAVTMMISSTGGCEANDRIGEGAGFGYR
jgi:hypothetical protein